MPSAAEYTPWARQWKDIKFYDTSYGCQFGYNERQQRFQRWHGFAVAARSEDNFDMDAPGVLSTAPIFHRNALGFRVPFPPEPQYPLRGCQVARNYSSQFRRPVGPKVSARPLTHRPTTSTVSAPQPPASKVFPHYRINTARSARFANRFTAADFGFNAGPPPRRFGSTC
mmetsp:Transcript_18615/g.26125  ORF Transcript_18615/g.26125 Transcript_18615/m.26125 type:complete len:170 (+) Transcript_18615:113-622(+)|eukprot:CAMPEP_0175096976 /NCGR_PEP_ID=MMETSP0086_2-20121207/5029_1 /TAXON_ID=136419 /ORGANISM="Unknown Unknown, Strain D1" /LENGTH=169 /DNA_ID=CAMNT_0016370433 /DNA_START=107 /DNA_END=616 /DNA_ORIENTATION=+